jgi:hypothetical protein
MLLEIPMYAPAIAQCVPAVKSMETYLDKAERLADAKKFDVGILLSTRLAPDMGGLPRPSSPLRLSSQLDNVLPTPMP